MIIHNGDHAEFEIEQANTKPEDRPDWPMPSFDANDWAKAFCKSNPGFDEGLALSWFAAALMRGYDEGRAKPREHLASSDCWCHPSPNSRDPITGRTIWIHHKDN